MWPDGHGDSEVRVENNERTSNTSDIVVMDERTLAVAAAAALPNISQLNVTKSKGVHLGPKFVTVNQNVHNTEVVKGRFMGLELISPKKGHRFRCSIAVFVCWAVVVATGLALYFFRHTLATPPTRQDLDIKDTWYLRRADWQALPAYRLTFLKLPVNYVLIGHTATQTCKNKYACIKEVLGIQKDHLGRGWDDIGPNFLVGFNGTIFEGRGANVIGAMVRHWNANSISIMFIGDYSAQTTEPEQFQHIPILLEELVKRGILDRHYILYGHCQVAPLIISPGKYIVKELYRLPHWNPANTTQCL